jgi:hypothetical protein
MWNLLKKVALVSLLTVAVNALIPLDCNYATNGHTNFYYDQNCTVRTCYQNYCNCTGQRMNPLTGMCPGNAECSIKNNCTKTLLKCLDNNVESNTTNSTCFNKQKTYNDIKNGPLIQYYLACESFLCKVMNFTTCSGNYSNICYDFITTNVTASPNATIRTTSSPNTTRLNFTTPIPTTYTTSGNDVQYLKMLTFVVAVTTVFLY